MPGQPNESIALLTTARAEADSNGCAPPHGSTTPRAKPSCRISFLDFPGLERPLPIVHAACAALPAELLARLEAWLCSRPEQLRILLSGEGALEISDCGMAGAGNAPLCLVPILGQQGLEGLVCLGANSRTRASDHGDSTVPWNLAAAMTQAIAQISGLRNRQDERGHLIEELANENRELRELGDLLQRQIEAQMKLVSNAVHQLRNPLVAVRGYVRMALDEELGPITALQRECLATVLENSTRMTGLLSDLSRSIAEQPLHCEALDFVGLWRESRDVFSPRILRKSIEFVERLPEGELLISGDRDKLALVLYKLLANTIRFTGPGGRVDARVFREQGFVSLSLCDTAEGIPPELVEKALGCGQLQSVGVSPQRPPASLIHEIVRLHGGEISVTSGINKGWRVTLRLPFAGLSNPPK